MSNTPTLADVRAAERVRTFALRTPVHTSDTLDRLGGRRLFFKCELFQKTGSFKYRGATNAVQRLDPATAARGVVTHSSGNHGQALALAARVRGIPARVIMPCTVPAVKKEAMIGYGGRPFPRGGGGEGVRPRPLPPRRLPERHQSSSAPSVSGSDFFLISTRSFG